MNIISFLCLQNQYSELKKRNPNAIVFFSEGDTYYNTNIPVISQLIKKGQKIIYLTLDKHDRLLTNPPFQVYPLLIDLGLLGTIFLKNIKANLFVTTTPGLGALALKKSRYVQHYSYIMHSPADIHRYAKFSFDCFDSIVCSGEFQIKSLNHLEQVRNFPIKEKTVLGVPYYDIMVEEFLNSSVKREDKRVLIAPSWGNSNFLNYYKQDLVEQLLNNGYDVILRPHPQSFKHEPKLIYSIVNQYKNNKKFTLDQNISNIESMKRASLLISSYSGMIFDFIFLTERPCILFDMKHIGNSFEDQDINFPSWETLLMPHIGKLVSLDSDLDLDQALEDISINYPQIIQTIQKAKQEIANFGCSAPKIADFYLSKSEGSY